MKLNNNFSLKPLLTATILSVALSSCVEKNNKAVADCIAMPRYGKVIPVPSTYRSVGKASYYGDILIGKETAYGETYTQDCMTAAHCTLPHDTRVHVVAKFVDGRGKKIEKSVRVRINDTGPFIRGTETPHPERPIDLSKTAFLQITEGLTAVVGQTGDLLKADGLSLGILQDIRITEVILPKKR